jgi:hypothetical protein
MKYHIKKTQMVFFKLYGSKVHTKPLQTDTIDHRFKHRSGQTKGYKIGILSSAKLAVVMDMTKDWLHRYPSGAFQ